MSKRSNIMALWKEYNPTSQRSIQDDFNDKPGKDDDRIIAYLKNGEIKVVTASRGVDVVTGDPIGGSCCILTDGEYSWTSELSYYVKQYHLGLPVEFVNKILSLSSRGN